jgi:hypothetical protein
MQLDELHEYLDIALAVAAVLSILIAVSRVANRKLEKKMVETILSSTQQIRTDSNGGQSLNDVNRRVTELDEKLDLHIDTQSGVDHKRDMQFQELKYELAAIKRIASYPAEGE